MDCRGKCEEALAGRSFIRPRNPRKAVSLCSCYKESRVPARFFLYHISTNALTVYHRVRLFPCSLSQQVSQSRATAFTSLPCRTPMQAAFGREICGLRPPYNSCETITDAAAHIPLRYPIRRLALETGENYAKAQFTNML